jgi:hypothetical protein
MGKQLGWNGFPARLIEWFQTVDARTKSMEPGMFRARFPYQGVPAVAGRAKPTSNPMRRVLCFLAGLAIGASGFHAWGGERNSALEALQALQTRIGPDACEVLVALHGPQGQDQPEEWIVLTLNPQSPNLGQQYVVNRNGVVDKGPPPGLYPSETPPGFVDRSQVLIDSPYAFQVLHEAAVRARVAFNSVNYTLVAKEYGKEPVWRLEAMDAKGRPVGQVDLSAKSGAIFRSVWYYWETVDGGAAWQGPRIVDSLLSDTALGSPGLSRPLEGEPASVPLASGGAIRGPNAETVKQTSPEAKEKGGLFARLRRGSRSLFGPLTAPSPSPPSPSPSVNTAPEAGVAVPVQAGESAGPTAEVAPANPQTSPMRVPSTQDSVPRPEGRPFSPSNR